MHGSNWKLNSWGYSLRLLAKVISHVYVGFYFENCFELFMKCLRNYDSCMKKRVNQGEGIIHVLMLRSFRIKA